VPDFRLEREFWSAGLRRVAGVDEAGRGCLFGPVVAAAVVFPPHFNSLPENRAEWPAWLREVNDSKLLSPARRERLARSILAGAEAVGLGLVHPAEIDRLNIYWASLEAMRRAVSDLAQPPDGLLLDGFPLKEVNYPQRPVHGGDRASVSIAAASIIAKVFRDDAVMRLDYVFKGYGLARHKGYGTPEHYRALSRLGPTPYHRRSFRLGPKAEGPS